MEKDRAEFQAKLDEIKKHKVKMLNPKVLNEIVASAAIVAYIDAFKQRLEDEC